MPPQVEPGAFEGDIAALQRIRRRINVTRMSERRRRELLKMCDRFHDALRDCLETPVVKFAKVP